MICIFKNIVVKLDTNTFDPSWLLGLELMSLSFVSTHAYT